MSREVRRVPETWQHPKDSNGRYIPLFDGFTKALQEWEKGKEMWDKGFRDNFQGGWIPLNPNPPEMAFEEWQGMKPVLGNNRGNYMPDFPVNERTHYQMYETCSEGTPISPVMKTPEEMAHWLADNGVYAFGKMTASYEAWLATIRRGGCSSFFRTADNELISGAEQVLREDTGNA